MLSNDVSHSGPVSPHQDKKKHYFSPTVLSFSFFFSPPLPCIPCVLFTAVSVGMLSGKHGLYKDHVSLFLFSAPPTYGDGPLVATNWHHTERCFRGCPTWLPWFSSRHTCLRGCSTCMHRTPQPSSLCCPCWWQHSSIWGWICAYESQYYYVIIEFMMLSLAKCLQWHTF